MDESCFTQDSPSHLTEFDTTMRSVSEKETDAVPYSYEDPESLESSGRRDVDSFYGDFIIKNYHH